MAAFGSAIAAAALLSSLMVAAADQLTRSVELSIRYCPPMTPLSVRVAFIGLDADIARLKVGAVADSPVFTFEIEAVDEVAVNESKRNASVFGLSLYEAPMAKQ